MKNPLPALFLLLFALSSCKKEKSYRVNISSISPALGASGTVVTISGTNLGASTNVFFNGVAGSFQSITPTEVKAFVPVTTSGHVSLTLGNQSVTGPVFTYNSIFTSPYTSGDVILKTQNEVDGFVNQNKGRQLQISGDLNIRGVDITSVAGLSNITSVSGNISLITCPLLTDVSFLNSITSAGSINVRNLAVSSITMDKLIGPTGPITVSACTNLNSLSLKSLTGVTTNIVVGNINIYSCGQLSRIDFSSLTSITGLLSISGVSISDLNGFSSLQTAGALTLSGNPFLVNFHGLEHLTTLSLPGVKKVSLAISSVISGLYIADNPKLTSLTGLQNLTSIPIARITSNVTLTDFCPLKAPIIQLSAMTPFLFISVSNDGDKSSFVPALTLTKNSNYATT